MFLTDLSIGEKYVFGFQVSVNEKIVMLKKRWQKIIAFIGLLFAFVCCWKIVTLAILNYRKHNLKSFNCLMKWIIIWNKTIIISSTVVNLFECRKSENSAH
jgi:hypothetical protein